ncbi:carboxypeptidase A1-like [Glandiceps talaboti]
MSSSTYKVLFTCLVVLLCLSFAVCTEKARYDGYQVLRAKIESDKDLAVMKAIYDTDKYDFWGYPSEVMVSPSQIDDVKIILDKHGIDYEVWISDVQEAVDESEIHHTVETQPEERIIRSASVGIAGIEEFDYAVYHRYAELDQWVKDTVARYPNWTEEIIIGRSYEKRVQRAIRILGTRKTEPKEAIWLQGGIHAREWISPATNIYMANQFIEDFVHGDPNVTAILDQFEIYVLPSVNPDGYDYTWNTDRLWRKTDPLIWVLIVLAWTRTEISKLVSEVGELFREYGGDDDDDDANTAHNEAFLMPIYG